MATTNNHTACYKPTASQVDLVMTQAQEKRMEKLRDQRRVAKARLVKANSLIRTSERNFRNQRRDDKAEALKGCIEPNPGMHKRKVLTRSDFISEVFKLAVSAGFERKYDSLRARVGSVADVWDASVWGKALSRLRSDRDEGAFKNVLTEDAYVNIVQAELADAAEGLRVAPKNASRSVSDAAACGLANLRIVRPGSRAPDAISSPASVSVSSPALGALEAPSVTGPVIRSSGVTDKEYSPPEEVRPVDKTLDLPLLTRADKEAETPASPSRALSPEPGGDPEVPDDSEDWHTYDSQVLDGRRLTRRDLGKLMNHIAWERKNFLYCSAWGWPVFTDVSVKHSVKRYKRESRPASWRTVNEISWNMVVGEVDIRLHPAVLFSAWMIVMIGLFMCLVSGATGIHHVSAFAGHVRAPPGFVGVAEVRDFWGLASLLSLAVWATLVYLMDLGLHLLVSSLMALFSGFVFWGLLSLAVLLLRTQRVLLLYIPHAVTCVMTEFELRPSSQYDSLGIRQRLRRLACLPVVDRWAYHLMAGSECVIAALMVDPDFSAVGWGMAASVNLSSGHYAPLLSLAGMLRVIGLGNVPPPRSVRWPWRAALQ